MSGREFFERTEFHTDNGQQNPEDAIQKRHDPDVGYAHILKLANSIDAGLEAVPEENRSEAEVYARVDLFRATMQYIEEFGTYLRAQAVQDENFIEALIRTSAKNLVPFFEACQSHTLDKYLNNQNVETGSSNWLAEIFGYNQVQDGRIRPPEDDSDQRPSDGEIDRMVSSSVSFIKSELEHIAEFYLSFKEAYNAVKHGNRVMVKGSPRFSIQSSRTRQQDFDLKDSYVSFLCKSSGDRSDGSPYILTLPSSFLEQWSLDIADRTNALYTQAYDITSVSEGEPVTVNFFNPDASGGGETITYHKIQNADSTVIFPKDNVPDVIDDLEFEDGTTVKRVAAWSLYGNTLHFDIEYATEPTPDHPIHVSVQFDQSKGELRELGTGHFDCTVNPERLSVKQYLELLDIQERDDITDIEFEFPGEGNTHSLSLDEPFEGIPVPRRDDIEFLEFTKRIELATQTRIPFPVVYSDEHYEIFERYRDESLDKDTAGKIINLFKQAGDETRHTQIIVEVWQDPHEQVKSNNIEPNYRELLDLVPECVEIKGEEIEKSRGEPGEFWQFEPAPSSYSVQKITEKVEAEGIKAIDRVQNNDLDSDDVETKIGYKVGFGGETIWGLVDVLYVGIFQK